MSKFAGRQRELEELNQVLADLRPAAGGQDDPDPAMKVGCCALSWTGFQQTTCRIIL